MPARKFYCDYCDKQFQDTPADRKRHVKGILHQQAKARWYDSFKQIPNPNPPLCFHLLNTGFCRHGESCKYLHPTKSPIETTPSPGNVLNLPPSLQPPPQGGYPHLPFLDWG
ncbi:zinc finger CCCH domain-containing protein 3 [Cajanus cajan]|uniref:Zinc finger CCCH domain-containing protein 3 n=1 Tax=Cajanus cajan TaxID=3821 RepID=A0A151U4N4_CAJCA|nr:zinc finger CCCH domain-containing protein 3 [Cajanus cajan]XP_020210656.1 zinc finger CCCH domain-containing protein 3 [Cajanus cajan]KYP39607.1 Zinc finger CCCH domain-containing protein 3 [Cajanus cajan]KYP74257.1 Zinc finger CCCH domain-containing protein 3 [Cajanus cajan]